MNIAFVGEPPERQIIDWEYAGIDDTLLMLYLECGHYWSGLTREAPKGDTLLCLQCTIVHLDGEKERYEAGDVRQLSLWEA